jgi:hypothetical protein
MSNVKGMTKSEAQKPPNAEDLFLDENPEWVVRGNPEKNRVYDLEERPARFGEAIIDFAKTIPQNPITNRLISQLVGAGTSVGANYVEADDSVSKKDFLKASERAERKPAKQSISSHDCSRYARAEAASARAVDGSQGAAFDLLKNLERSKA